MIEITDTTRWNDLTDEEVSQLTEDQASLLLERDLIDEHGRVRLPGSWLPKETTADGNP